MYIDQDDERMDVDSQLIRHEMGMGQEQKQVRHQEIEDLLAQPRRQGQEYEMTSLFIIRH